jgi:hypothetical protein
MRFIFAEGEAAGADRSSHSSNPGEFHDLYQSDGLGLSWRGVEVTLWLFSVDRNPRQICGVGVGLRY